MSRTYNDPGQRSNFINGTGAVDIYGLDAYPQGFDCSHPRTWRPVTTNYHQYHIQNNPSQPWYIPEFQGGSFDAWGPNAPGKLVPSTERFCSLTLVKVTHNARS